jgi:hypothetical protein
MQLSLELGTMGTTAERLLPTMPGGHKPGFTYLLEIPMM